ncbi:AEC family transporter (plasmid) [Photobacterium sp. DA100]|uniref:AEC family transporter n=1 Tax=Photobacterium sp. DA100 TaxID=3027472 RepID=UPI002479F030|nr:AEC family transporter [Photobacterium sp. DA100]WEM44655.1 AEC family transporter [Photobacterium sp. DA100]
MSVAEILAPIVVMISVGYFAVSIGAFSKSFVAECGKFVMYIALPALIILNVSTIELSEAISFNYLLVYGVTGLAAMTIGFIASRALLKNNSKSSAMNSLGCALSNSAFVGIPIVIQVFEDTTAQAFVMCFLIENIILIPLAFMILEITHNQSGKSKKAIYLASLTKLTRNPMIIAVTIGFAINIFDVSLPSVVGGVLEMAAKVSTGLALFVIGGSLVGATIKANISRSLLVCSTKLIICPVIALLLTFIFPLDGELQLAVILFSAMPMLSIYPVIGGQYGDSVFCSSTLLITTLLSGVTLSVILYVNQLSINI